MFKSLHQNGRLILRRNSHIKIAKHVQKAVIDKQPVIALESTILTHGLPPKEALEVSQNLENIAHKLDVVPATIGILNGKLIVGMSADEQRELISAAEAKLAGKAALKDLPLILSEATINKSFGTTVSATLYAAHRAGIPIFATGGIGGVHRGAESTFDISSDLTALSRFSVAVVSAGVKSILDIGKTLELLETLSVTVVSHGTNEFPAFFTSRSGISSPARIDSIDQAAAILGMIRDELKLNQGLLIAVPNLGTSEELGNEIEEAVQRAVKEAEEKKIKGQMVTPFILEKVRNLTGNKSFEANVQLISNNVRYACELAKLYRAKEFSSDPKVVVIGGSNIDHTIKITQNNVKSSQDLNPPGSFLGEIHSSNPGGVGRNMAELLSKFQVPHSFLTAVKHSDHDLLLKGIENELAQSHPGDRTASYLGVLSPTNDLLFGVADMNMHRRIDSDFVDRVLSKIQRRNLKVILFDANIEVDVMRKILDFCTKNKTEAWLEPTDRHKVDRIIQVYETNPKLSALGLIAPNEFEFQELYKWKLQKEPDFANLSIVITDIRAHLLPVSANFLIKMGEKGILFVNKRIAIRISSPVSDQKEILSASGAGDSLIAAVLYARHHLGLLNWEACLLIGLRAAELSMKSNRTVPEMIDLDEFREKRIQEWARARNLQIDHPK